MTTMVMTTAVILYEALTTHQVLAEPSSMTSQ